MTLLLERWIFNYDIYYEDSLYQYLDSYLILEYIYDRFLGAPFTIIYFFFWVCVIVWLLFKDTIINIVFRILAWIMSRIKGVIISNKEEEELVRAKAFSQDFYKEIFPAPLENMLIRNEVAKKAFKTAK